MIRDAGRLTDGGISFEGGMDSGVAPTLIDVNKISFAVNTTLRGSYPKSRPGFKQIRPVFENEEKREWFENHIVQGSIIYDPPNGGPVVVVSCGGRIFEFRPRGSIAQVIEITPASGRNSQNQEQVWFCQAAQYLVIQDGQSLPIIYDGATSRRADPTTYEVPIGKQMAFGNYRLFVVLVDGRQILAGDFAGVTATSVLEFTETTYLNGGGSLGLPLESGEIRSLIFTAQTNTVAGQGVLLAATQRTIMSFNPVPIRTDWDQNGFSSIALINSGFESQYGTTHVNGDVWGRSFDGLRSFIMATREFASWGNTPLSHEMNRVIEKDGQDLLNFSSSIYFDNRLLTTCSPVALVAGTYHRGMIALNFDNNSGIANRGKAAAYDGLWTGIQPYYLITGLIDNQQRAYAFTRGVADSKTELWEITKDDPFDSDNCRITSFIETRSMVFGAPFTRKRLVDGEIWVDELTETVNFDVKFRPDQNPCWSDWTNLSECAPVAYCNTDFGGCTLPVAGKPQYRWISFGQPKSVACDPVLNKPFSIGYDFQIRLQWTGHARIKKLLIHANPMDEAPRGSC